MTIFRIPDIYCYHTGTSDHGVFDPNNDKCRACTYQNICKAEDDINKNLATIEEAKELWEQGEKLEEEAKELKDRAKLRFNKLMTNYDLIKFQIDNYVVSSVLVQQQKTYPKAKLLKVFSEEQLELAAEIKPQYTYLKVNNTLKKTKKEF